jgi:hypothetical protein
MQHGLHDIYCSAQHDQCSLIIRTFWLHGVVGADLRPDTGSRSLGMQVLCLLLVYLLSFVLAHLSVEVVDAG